MDTSEPSTSTTTQSSISDTNCGQTEAKSGGPGGESTDDFLSTGRTGRRNAMPDILEEKSSQLSTSDLPNELQKLNFNDTTQPNGSSGESSGSPSCSKENN